MKNAYVTEHHLGDNGAVSEGMILEGITTTRFKALEKKGLVREATAAEVKDGYKAPFVASGIVIADEEQPEPDGGGKAAGDHLNKKAAAPANKGA